MPFDLARKDPARAARMAAQDPGIDPMTLNLGPQHPAMHGVVRVVAKVDGEVIVWADTEMGYLHRGFEKTVENRTWNQVVPYTDRLNYVSPFLNNIGYALAVEKLAGIEAPERCQYIRVVMGEISRIMDHETCLAAIAMEMGGMTPFLYLMRSREYFMQLVEEVAGARLTVSWARVGGLTRDLPASFSERFEWCAQKMLESIAEADTLLTRNRIFMDRMRGVGAISAERAMANGFTGPVLRSTGVDYDVRKAAPYLVYDRLPFDVPVGSEGDNYDRYLVRLEEMRQSLRIIREALRQMPEGPVNVADPRYTLPPKEGVYRDIESLIAHFKLLMPGHGLRIPKGEVYHAVEGGNGELGFWIISDGTDRPWRVRLRPPCLPLLAGLAEMAVGGQVADLIPTFGSINMIAGELDR